jgi:hypothetical protein
MPDKGENGGKKKKKKESGGFRMEVSKEIGAKESAEKKEKKKNK